MAELGPAGQGGAAALGLPGFGGHEVRRVGLRLIQQRLDHAEIVEIKTRTDIEQVQVLVDGRQHVGLLDAVELVAGEGRAQRDADLQTIREGPSRELADIGGPLEQHRLGQPIGGEDAKVGLGYNVRVGRGISPLIVDLRTVRRLGDQLRPPGIEVEVKPSDCRVGGGEKVPVVAHAQELRIGPQEGAMRLVASLVGFGAIGTDAGAEHQDREQLVVVTETERNRLEPGHRPEVAGQGIGARIEASRLVPAVVEAREVGLGRPQPIGHHHRLGLHDPRHLVVDDRHDIGVVAGEIVVEQLQGGTEDNRCSLLRGQCQFAPLSDVSGDSIQATQDETQHIGEFLRVGLFEPQDRFLVEDVIAVQQRIGGHEERHATDLVRLEDLLEGQVGDQDAVAFELLAVRIRQGPRHRRQR